MNTETRPSFAGRLLARARQLPDRVDRLQQRIPPVAVAVATWKKFTDDQAGNLAALIAYFAFFSLFPLLLIGVTILDLVLRGDPHLREQLLKTALSQYPVIGPELARHAHGLSGTGTALVIGAVLTLFGARGVAYAMQNALNSVWAVPQFRRPSFPWSLVRSLGLMAVIGPGLVATTTLSGYAGGIGHLGSVGARVAASAVSLLLNVGLFWLGFRLAAAREIGWRDLRLSAILAAIAWQVLQLLGGYFISHELRTTSAYGFFGVVLGLLAWFFLQAQITLYVAELNVVLVRALWPRSLNPPPLTDADMRCYQLYAEAGRRRPDVDVEVQPAPDDGTQTGGPGRQ
jgi:membrane protein